MRMRKKKHGAERIAACSEILIPQPEQPVDPQSYFSENRPIHLEIGCGKGDFAVGMSAAHPECNWIAMERVSDVACLALEKAMRAADTRPDNLRFLIGDARNAAEWFPENSVDCLYLNFSDPWPKSGYARRRLTHQGFLELYRAILKENGMLFFKTDNEGLFEFSLEQFELCGLKVEWLTRDLHASEKAERNIMTEYERNFSQKGQPIYSAWVRFGKETAQ
ncbi:MAG: tRNA (guanosine(46)-N7)-methyltransferase TrmB [Ruminococcaceae bacterium]|nr:tRNA (guanosine(46)-N7)-methyltransferase TrmB [Oscillospiraceae bacterium]